MTTEELIRIVTDKDLIRELRYRFGLALDQRDWPLFTALFTDEVDADFDQIGVPARRMAKAELTGMFQHAFRREGMRTQQLYSNFLIEPRGDSAHCISYLYGHHHLPGFEGGEIFEIRAAYHDRLLRLPSGWRIAAVRLEVLSMVGNVAMIT